MATVSVIPEVTRVVVDTPEEVVLTLTSREAEYVHWLVAHVKLDWLNTEAEYLNNRIYNAMALRYQQPSEDGHTEGVTGVGYAWSDRHLFGSFPGDE